MPSWTTILDQPHPDELILRDFRDAQLIEDRTGPSKLLPYTLAAGTSGHALWGGPSSPDFAVDPGLTGWHAIFFSVYRPDLYGLAKFGGTSKLKLASDEFWTPFSERENREIVCPQPGTEKPKFCAENFVELELFLGIRQLDNEQLLIRNDDSCIMSLRFVPMTAPQVEAYHADIADPENRRIILNFETFGTPPAELLERISRYEQSGVAVMHMEFTAGNTENVLYAGSKHTDDYGAIWNDDEIASLKPWVLDHLQKHRDYLENDSNPFDAAVPAAHAAGIKVVATSRMAFNLVEDQPPSEWEKSSIDDYCLENGRFYREHPELRVPKSTGGSNLDYFYPEVQNHVIDIFCEAVELIDDIDGISMDFRTWPPWIRKEADFSVMVDFVREMRRRIDEVGERKGKRLTIAAEFVDGMYNLTLPEQRIDIEAWLASGAVDYIAIEGQDLPCYQRPPDKTPAEYIALGKKYGVPVYPRNDSLYVLGLDPEVCGGSQPALPPGLYTIGHDPFWGDEYNIDLMGNVGPRCGPLHYQMGVQKHYDDGAEMIVLSNVALAHLGSRRLGHPEHLRVLNAAGRVFGQLEGETITWDERVTCTVDVAAAGPWQHGAAEVTVRVTIDNAGKARSTGRIELSGAPPEVVDGALPDHIDYDLEPGQSSATDIPITSLAPGFAVKAMSENPAVACNVLDWRADAWSMSSLPPVAAIDEIETALAAEQWQQVYWLADSFAAVRMATAGDDTFVLHAKVTEPQGLLQRSKIEIFVSRPGDDALQSQAFMPLPPEPHRVSSWLLSELFDKSDFEGGTVAGAPCSGPFDSAQGSPGEGWKILSVNGIGFEDVHGRFGARDGICYLANRFTVARAGRWEMRIGHDGGARIWVDGEVVLTEPKLANPAQRVRSKPVVELDAGEHEVVIAFDTGGGNGWGFFFGWGVPDGDMTEGFPTLVEFEQFPSAITETADGYEVKAILPRALFGLSRDDREFNLECLVTAGAADFGWHTCGIFGNSFQRRFMKVDIE